MAQMCVIWLVWNLLSKISTFEEFFLSDFEKKSDTSKICEKLWHKNGIKKVTLGIFHHFYYVRDLCVICYIRVR